MKLWTQYQILVQFCFQGTSAWHSVALILAAVETWTVLWDVLSSLTKNPSCSPTPICCLGTHRDMDLLFSSQRPLPWQLLSPLTSPCPSSSLLAGVPWQGPRETRRQRVCGACWCPSQGCWAVLHEELGRGHCWRAAVLQCTHAPSRSRRNSAAQGEERAWAAVLNCAQEKGMESGCSSICCLLISWI